MLATQSTHFVNGQDMFAPISESHEQVLLGMGCFWGAERLLWQTDGVIVTSVGYGGGHDDSPTYDSVCRKGTGHAELVHVVYDPAKLPFAALLKLFFESHNPTQGDRQGNDVGSQYRSYIGTYTDAQMQEALNAKARYNEAYAKLGDHKITTDIEAAPKYHPAEDYHQQYLAKNPGGYCGIGGTGVSCPVPQTVTA